MAEVQLIYLPLGEDGSKQGVDDFLAAGNSVEDLIALATTELREPPREEEVAPPIPYRATPHGLVLEKPTEDGLVDTPLTNFNARITGDVVEDDGAEKKRAFEIEAELRGRRSSFSVPAERFSGMAWPSEHLGAAAIVNPGFGTKDHARAAIQMLSGDIPLHHLYAHIGWRKIDGGWVYLHAGGPIGPEGPLTGVEVSLGVGRLGGYLLPTPPSGDELRRAILASLRFLELAPLPITVPLLAATYRAPLGEAAPVDLSLALVGPTGTQKTELTAMAQAHYGAAFNGRHLPANWTSTENALEKQAFSAKDAVLVVDDFAPAGTLNDVTRLHRTADRFLRAQGNRSGRGRMRADTTLRAEYYPRGLIVSSGEDVPRGQSLRSRMLVLELSPGDVDLDVLTGVQQTAAEGLLSSSMSAYVRYLAPRMDGLKVALPTRLKELRAQAAGAGTHARTPDAVASLFLGLEQFLEFAVESEALTEVRAEELRAEGWRALVEAANAQSEHQSGEEPTRQFLDLLAACIVAGDAHVASKAGGKPKDAGHWGWRERSMGTDEYERSEWQSRGKRVGWLDDDGSLLLEPGAAFAAAQRMAREQGGGLPIAQRTLWKRMAERGLLASRDTARSRNTARANIAGERRTVVHLVPGALSPENGPIGPNDPAPLGNGPSGSKRRAAPTEGDEETARENGPELAQTPASGPEGPLGPFPRGRDADGGGQATREALACDPGTGREDSVRPGEEDEFSLGNTLGDSQVEEEVNYREELAGLGWRRAETSFSAAAGVRDAAEKDPVVCELRHAVGIYKGRNWWSDLVGPSTPLAFAADDLLEAKPRHGDREGEDAIPWPTEPEEVRARLRRSVAYLRAGKRRFWDPGFDEWAFAKGFSVYDPEKACKEANLHAELWTKEGTSEEIWALVALSEGWYVPNRAIEEAVWRRATFGRSPWAGPEYIPEEFD